MDAPWPIEKLGSIASFRNGINYSSDNFGRGIRVINVKDFQDYSVPKYDELSEINPAGVVREAHLLTKNDIVLVRSNGNRDLIGRSLFISDIPEAPTTHSAFSIRLRFSDVRKTEPRFYFYLLRSGVVRQVLSSHGNGANISNLNQDILSRLEVPVPPVPIQRRIADILKAYDDLIELNKRRVAILEELARRTYEEWFVRYRFPGGNGTKPDSWKTAAFSAIAEVLSGGTPKKLEPEYWGGNIPFFTPKDTVDQPFVLSTSHCVTELGVSKCSSGLYDRDTIFITARGTVGKVQRPAVPMAINQSCYALRGRDGVTPAFLYQATLAIVRELKGKAHGAVFDTIIKSTFDNVLIDRPDNETIVQFERVMSPASELLLSILLQNANLRAQRDLLLPQLVSGEIDVSEVADPAKVAAE